MNSPLTMSVEPFVSPVTVVIPSRNWLEENFILEPSPESTAADHYAGWDMVAYYGMWPDGSPVDVHEALANAIGWASRD